MLDEPCNGEKIIDEDLYNNAFSDYEDFMSKIIIMSELRKQISRLQIPLIFFEKGDVIYNAGDIHHSGYYIISGLCRSYFINDSAKEITWEFYFNNKDSNYINRIAGDYNSVLQKTISHMYLEVMEDTYCFELKNIESNYIFLLNKTRITFMKFLCQEYNKELLSRYLDLYTTSAKERIEKKFKHNAFLIEKVTQKHMSSYLGISSETFSRLKKEVLQND